LSGESKGCLFGARHNAWPVANLHRRRQKEREANRAGEMPGFCRRGKMSFSRCQKMSPRWLLTEKPGKRGLSKDGFKPPKVFSGNAAQYAEQEVINQTGASYMKRQGRKGKVFETQFLQEQISNDYGIEQAEHRFANHDHIWFEAGDFKEAEQAEDKIEHPCRKDGKNIAADGITREQDIEQDCAEAGFENVKSHGADLLANSLEHGVDNAVHVNNYDQRRQDTQVEAGFAAPVNQEAQMAGVTEKNAHNK
jgi:hypothetical protein